RLPSCDGEGGMERFLGRRGIGRAALEQHFAANAVKLRLESAMSCPLARRERFVEDDDGAAWVAGLGLGPREGNLCETVKNQDVLRAQAVDATAHAIEPAEQVALDPRPPIEKHSEGAELGEVVRAGNSSELQGICLPPHRAAEQQRELRRKHLPERDRVAM